MAHARATEVDLNLGPLGAYGGAMTTPDTITAIPVRLDFEAHAAGFARALGHLDKAATKELDHVDFEPRLRELVRIRLPAQRLRLLRRHAHQGRPGAR